MNRPPPRNRRPEGQNQVQQRNAQSNSDGNVQAATQTSIEIETQRLHSGAVCDGPLIIEIPQLPPIPEVVWQQHLETSTSHCNLNNTNIDFTIHYTQETLKMTLASQTSPPKRTQPQNYVVATEDPPGNQTVNEPVPFLNSSKNFPTEIQISEQHVTTTHTGDTTIPPLTTTTPLIEEGLVRDKQTNEVYLPITSTVVLKRKQEKLYVPLDFENKLTVDALVDSRAFVSAIAQNDLRNNKREMPEKVSQSRRSSQFSDKSSQWPVRKTISNSNI